MLKEEVAMKAMQYIRNGIETISDIFYNIEAGRESAEVQEQNLNPTLVNDSDWCDLVDKIDDYNETRRPADQIRIKEQADLDVLYMSAVRLHQHADIDSPDLDPLLQIAREYRRIVDRLNTEAAARPELGLN